MADIDRRQLGAALSRYGYGTVTQARGDVPGALALYRDACTGGRSAMRAVSRSAWKGSRAPSARLESQHRRPGCSALPSIARGARRPVPCNALASYGGLVRSVRDCLGETAFNDAWLAGYRLSADEAITEASRSIAALAHPDRQALAPAQPRPSLTRREHEVLCSWPPGMPIARLPRRSSSAGARPRARQSHLAEARRPLSHRRGNTRHPARPRVIRPRVSITEKLSQQESSRVSFYQDPLYWTRDGHRPSG